MWWGIDTADFETRGAFPRHRNRRHSLKKMQWGAGMEVYHYLIGMFDNQQVCGEA